MGFARTDLYLLVLRDSSIFGDEIGVRLDVVVGAVEFVCWSQYISNISANQRHVNE